MRVKEMALLVLLAAIWGSSYLFIRVAAPAFGPVLVALLRVVVALGGLLVWIALSGQHGQIGFDRRFLILGAVNAAVPYGLIAFAELHLTASLASILNATTPLFTAIVAATWTRTRPTARTLLGCVLGLAGVGYLAGWNPGQANTGFVLAVAAMLGASLAYGIGSVYAKEKLNGVSALRAATGQQFGAAIALAPFGVVAVASGRVDAAPTLGVAAAVLALGLICTSLAYLLYFRLIASVGAVNTSSVTFLIPIFGITWSALFLGESPPPGALIGLGLILGSVFLVTGRGASIPILKRTTAS